jgi:hypothetical protein
MIVEIRLDDPRFCDECPLIGEFECEPEYCKLNYWKRISDVKGYYNKEADTIITGRPPGLKPGFSLTDSIRATEAGWTPVFIRPEKCIADNEGHLVPLDVITIGAKPLDVLMGYQEFHETIGAKFVEAMKQQALRVYTYGFRPYEISLFHGLIALAADHPGIQDMSSYTHAQIYRFRKWCMEKWVEMGMTQEEAELLDRLREASDGDSSV